MSALADKIRRARESRVEVGDLVFIIRRPTPVDMMDLGITRDFARCVVGWDKVREMDLLPGGDPHPAPFDAEACREWLRDRPDLYGPVVEKVLAAYQAHVDALEAAAKN